VVKGDPPFQHGIDSLLMQLTGLAAMTENSAL
jgi:hypothetical protein